MMENTVKGLYDLEIYQIARKISGLAWKIYNQLPKHFQFTIGNQFLDSADSISANISEGYGRYHYKDSMNFNFYARGSCFELRDWAEKLMERELCDIQDGKDLHGLVELEIMKINGYNNYLRSKFIQNATDKKAK
jgi:four helix bundle protein